MRQITLGVKSGRLEIYAAVLLPGDDLQVCLTGGKAHIGAVGCSNPDGQFSVTAFPGHREAEIAAKMAAELAQKLDCNAVVSAGIHYEGIGAEEIDDVKKMANLLASQIILAIRQKRANDTDRDRGKGKNDHA